MPNSAGSARPHDHNACISQALATAKQICERNGTRLTRLRRQVLELVWQSHRPLGAYALMDLLQSHSDRDRVAPPTVYRALDFLLECGFIHKVHSLNAFIGRQNPTHSGDTEALFICSQCNHTEEVHSTSIQQAINLNASQHKFTVNAQIVEITGLCFNCKKREKG